MNQLMNQIRQYGFALDEIQLYLDTHPDCPKGLAYYELMKQKRNETVKAYECQFGPLTADAVKDGSGSWSWVNDPWPWEGGC